MRIRLGVPRDLSQDEKAQVLDAALEATTRASEPMVARGWVPTAMEAIDNGLVRWRPEPPGDEHFDLPSVVLGRNWGDCDDLAPWHAASLRVTGVDPAARAIVVPSGPGKWHAIVERSDGSIDDPSLAAGMGSVSGADDYLPPFWAPMADGRLVIAHHPLARGSLAQHAARVDVPDAMLPIHWSGVWQGPTIADAIVGAIQGALVGAYEGSMYEEDAAVLGSVHDLLIGCRPEEVQEALEHVGFLPGIAAALPLVSSVASAIPGLSSLFGGGAPPPAAAAPPAAAPAAPPGFGGGGGFPSGGGGYGYGPMVGPTVPSSGPIVIRF